MENQETKKKSTKVSVIETNSTAIKVKVLNTSDLEMPKMHSKEASGFDLRADLTNMSAVDCYVGSYSVVDDGIAIAPLSTVKIPSGVRVEMPKYIDATVAPRSGVTLKTGLKAQIGTIDSDYRGDIGVILVNVSNQTEIVKHGDRVAQLKFNLKPLVELVPISSEDELSSSERGGNGFGHSGVC